MPRLIDHLQTLAVRIGPRRSAGPEEAAAAEYAAGEFRAMGLEVQRQRFSAPATFSWTYILLYAFAPLAAALFPFRPGLAFFLGLCGGVLYLAESATFPIVSRLLPKGRSVNVIAKAHARSKELRRVLVLAHLDSSRSALNFAPNMVGGFRRTYLLTVAGLLGPIPLYGAAVLIPGAPRLALWLASLPCAALVLVALFSLLHREAAGRVTPGANDDASGIAALLEIARVVARAPLPTTSVWFVATGAEESGLWGALHLIGECRFDPGRTQVINLDNLGKGRLALTTAEGMIFPLHAGPALLEAARSAAEEKGIALDLRRYRLLTTDATAFMARKIPAATVMAFDERGLLPNWHWPTDTAENVDEANLEAARDLV
ncbi:MAG: M28 family metallopeptidase, partial [Patescibacteria group bacterium]